MNLVKFLKQVDSAAKDMTKDALESFIHEYARTLPEEDRTAFLQTMSLYCKADIVGQRADTDHRDELSEKVAQSIEVLSDINDGDRFLDSEINEEWDDWYNSDAEEFLYSDPESILPDIEQAIELLHRCIDEEAYESGCKLAEQLSFIEIPVEGDCYETVFDLSDLYLHDLIDENIRDVVREALFLTYMGNALDDRADELYCKMINFKSYDIKLEDIMQTGSGDLPEFEKFLPLWIDYLGSKTGSVAQKLMEEAQAMIEDDETSLQTAVKFADTHPELFRNILECGKDSGEDEKYLKIGMDALELIPEKYVIRSEIALLCADFAIRTNEVSTAEYCWMEAFRSDTSVINYMRLRFMSKDWTVDIHERTPLIGKI